VTTVMFVPSRRDDSRALAHLRHYNVFAFMLCFCSFLWTLYGRVFNAPGAARRAPTVIRLLGPPFIVVYATFLVRVRTGYGRVVMSALMYTAAFLLFWWCTLHNGSRRLSLVFSGDKPDHIRTDGPYKYVRHPFYCSYCLAWFASAIGSSNCWVLLSALLTTAIYYAAARKEEAGFATSALASQYARYRAGTGMFFPRVVHLPGVSPPGGPTRRP
jgi:protein-S-isoprenylcysteine O-methyltransferase Ste14